MESQVVQIWGIVVQVGIMVLMMLGGFWKINENLVNKIYSNQQDNDNKLAEMIKDIDSKIETKAMEAADKIRRTYERIDQRCNDVANVMSKEYLKKEIHDIEKKNQVDRIDEKFKTTIESFELKLGSIDTTMKVLSGNVKELYDRFNKKQGE